MREFGGPNSQRTAELTANAGLIGRFDFAGVRTAATADGFGSGD